MKGIGDTTEILIQRPEANFDRACDAAYRYAVGYFEIDEDGHSRRVRDWDRGSCWIEVRFLEYVRMGNEHVYKFSATTKRSEE